MRRLLRENWVVLLLFFIGLSFKLFIFSISGDDIDYDFDPVTKIYLTVVWLESGGMGLPDFNFGPLHTYLIAASLALCNNILLTPRFLSLFFGSILIFPFYYLIKALFDKKIAILSSMFLCVYSIHVRCSVVSYAIAPFAFFLFMALCFFFLFKKKKRLSCLILSALFLNLACMLRFEGWVFIPILTILMWEEKKRYLLLFLSLAMIFPLFLMIVSYKEAGYALQFARTNAAVVSLETKGRSLGHRIFGMVKTLQNQLTPLVFVLGLLGLIYSFWRRQHIALGILFLVFFMSFEYKAIMGTIDLVVSKYTCCLGLLLIAYAFFGLTKIIGLLKNVRLKRLATALVMIFILWSSAQYTLNSAQGHTMRDEIEGITLWLKQNATAEDRIVLDDYYHPYIVVGSRLRIEQFITPSFFTSSEGLKQDLFNILRNIKPEYIVYSFEQGRFRLVFDFSQDLKRQEWYGYRFDSVYNNGKYRIYKVISVLEELE